MIKVHIQRKKNLIQSIEISGHALSDEYGKDLVCAGVSAMTTGICNTLAKKDFMNHGSIVLENGYVHIEVFDSSDEYQLILETLETSLETVEETYAKYIKINKTEV